jgi:hypothetical protein
MGHSLTNADGAFPALRHVAYMDRARTARVSTPAALNRMRRHNQAFRTGRNIKQASFFRMSDRTL